MINLKPKITIKLKHIALVQAVVILILLGVILKISYYDPSNGYSNGLLSSRVYSKILKPGSFLLTNFAPLDEALTKHITKNKLEVSVYVKNLKNGAAFGINDKQKFPPASLTKVLIAILVIKKIEKENLSLEHTLLDISEADRAETAGTLYLRPEKKLPVKTLLEYMLKESDNTALKILSRYTDLEDRTFIMNYVDYPDRNQAINTINLNDETAILITPRSMYNIFSSLYFSTILQPKHSEFILSALTNTTFNINEAAELSDDVLVAHKYGNRYIDNEKLFHDCGIMYIHSKDMKLFYCVMSKDLDLKIAAGAVGSIVHEIYSYSLDARNKFDEYKIKLYEPKTVPH